MLIWGAVWGAILGLMWPGYGSDFKVVTGALLGLAAGWTLRKGVRKEVEAARRALPAAAVQPPAGGTPPVYVDQTDTDAPLFEPMLETAAPASGVAAPAAAEPAGAFFADTLPPAQPEAVPAKAAPTPRPPAPPSAFDQALAGVRNWFVQGNPIVRAGLVILFIGLSFLARYAAQAGLLPARRSSMPLRMTE